MTAYGSSFKSGTGMANTYDSGFMSGRAFSYGPIGMPPWTTTFTLSEGGKVAGYSHPNEQFWEVRNSVLLIFNERHEISAIFDSAEIAFEQIKLLGRTDQDKSHNVSLCEIVVSKYDLASFVSPSGIWNSRSNTAVFVRSVNPDEKFLDLIRK